MKKLVPLILFLSASASFGRIGETLDECQARYGAMIGTDMSRSDYPAYAFRKDGVEIRVRLYNAKSAQEIFFGINSELSLAQIHQIQSANFSGADVKGHSEAFNPTIDEDTKRIAAL